MAGVTYFVQACPTCGRNLQVRVTYLVTMPSGFMNIAAMSGE